MLHIRQLVVAAAISCLALTTLGCAITYANGTSTSDSLTLSLTSSFITLPPDGTTNSVIASIARSKGNTLPVTLTVRGAPAGVTVTVTQPGTGSYGLLLLTSSATVTGGVSVLTISATDGTATSTTTLTTTLVAADVITIAPTTSALIARQDATPVSTVLSVTRTFGNTADVTVSASGLPTGLTATFTQPGSGSTGLVTFTTSPVPAAAGVYSITLMLTDGKVSTTSTMSITVAVVLTVANATDTSLGLSGHLQQFLSTGFQPSTYNNDFFSTYPSIGSLGALNPEHIRLQPVVGALPWSANSSPQAGSDWSFTALDQTVQPVLTVGDESPIFQIAKAPGFLDDANGHFVYNATNLALLTTYAQNLVRYYNTGGFTWGGQHFQSPSSTHIKWWAIFNEPNLNNITAAQYVSLYNTLVPAMLAIDPTLKFVALELSDFTGQPALFLPALVQPAASGGINAQMDAIATHFYGTCMQTATDAKLFSGVSQFVTDIQYFRSELALRSDLAAVPVWVTENNINSDYPLTSGYDDCTPNLQYVLDTRSTSAFFTAYRPLVFSQLGKARNQALYHFLYEGSLAYGEVNSANDAKQLSYWTDYWLQRTFPWNGMSAGAAIYKTTSTEPAATVEILATYNTDSSVSLLVTNYAVASSSDDNGAGAPRTVYVNLGALGAFHSATEVDLNAATSTNTGPVISTFTPATTLPLTFMGYGTSVLVLRP